MESFKPGRSFSPLNRAEIVSRLLSWQHLAGAGLKVQFKSGLKISAWAETMKSGN